MTNEQGREAEPQLPLPIAKPADDAGPAAVPGVHDHHFQTDDLIGNLGKRSISSGKIAIVSSGISFVLQLGTLAILGRLLDPVAFGLVGMVSAFTAFITAFKDLGLSQASIQSDEANHQNVSTMFWLNAAAGVVSACIVVAIGPFLASFYNQSELVAIAAATGAAFALGGFTTQHIALMQRRFRHMTVAIVRTSSQIFGSIVGIVAAYNGAGYWALVLIPLSSSAYALIAAWASCKWRPGRPMWSTGVRAMLLFSLPLVGAELLATAMRNVDNILIGKFAGAAELGFYVMAYRMLLFPIRQINVPLGTVTLPTFARLKDDPPRFVRMYEKAIAGICLAGMPVVGAAFASCEAFLPLLLGEQWTPSINIFRALGLAALMATHNVAGGWAATATGHTGRRLKWAMIGPPITIVSYAIGGYFGGALGVALAFSISEFITRPIAFWYILKPTPVKLKDVQRASFPPMIATALGAALGTFVTAAINDQSSVGRTLATLAGCSAFMLVFTGYLAIAPHARLHRELVRTLAAPTLARIHRIFAKQKGPQ